MVALHCYFKDICMSRISLSPIFSALTAICAFLLIIPCTLPADQLPVFVSIPPQKYFVQQIGMDLVKVQVMVAPGASPATYEPKPAQMTALARARIYFSIGVPFESAWLKKIAAANPKLMVVPTDHGIAKLTMASHHHAEQKTLFEKEQDHPNGLTDPHIWTSPPLVMMQARSILIALQACDPANHALYETNYKHFIDDLIDLDAELRQILAGKKGASFIVFHPSWGYFADAYELQQIAIEIEGKDPKPAQLQELIGRANEKNIKAVFVQPQFSSKNADVIAKAIGGRIIPADPLAADWAANLRTQALQFRAALR
jgi:zinc transport system substrate-binding protein